MQKSKCQTCGLRENNYISNHCSQCFKSIHKNDKPRIASQNFYDVM